MSLDIVVRCGELGVVSITLSAWFPQILPFLSDWLSGCWTIYRA